MFSSYTRFHLTQQLKNLTHIDSAASTHSILLKSGLIHEAITATHLLNSYVRLKQMMSARKLFDEMPERTVVSWTSLISGYIEVRQPGFALLLYAEMVRSPVMRNDFTLATGVKACSVLADLETGKRIHAHVEVLGFRSNYVLCSALVDMYGKCNEVDNARRVFDLMEYSNRNVVSWTSMVAAYAQNARGEEALEIFREFIWIARQRPNHFMLASVVNACAVLGRLVSGKATHSALIRGGYELNEVVMTTLVDMYGKCGLFSYSEKVFRRILNPSVIPYTSMIVGAAKYGLGELSLSLFDEMTSVGIKPSDVTFLGVLYACSHSGMVNEGLAILDSMHKKHGVTPDSKHYTCVVDMLCRVGRLGEAYSMAKSIDVDLTQGALLWGTLLSASRLQGRVDIAVEASKWLIESDQQVSGAYVLLSNTYASTGDWKNASNLRSEMKRMGIHKEPGCSWVEVRDSTYVFYAGDISCERGDEMITLLRELERRMKERGYVRERAGLVFVDVEEEAKEEIVGLHSERLALAFALISLPKGVTIRVMKNLRMCSDCHEAFKLISDIVQRDIVVRDSNRFHHFVNGSCTCRDFW